MNPRALLLVAPSLLLACSGGAGGGGSDGGGAGDGGDCPATSRVTTIVSASGPFGRAALDDQHVYVPGKFSADEGVESFPRAGGNGAALGTPTLGVVTPDLGLLVGSDVWFVGGSSGNVYKVPVAGGAYTTVGTGYRLIAQRRLAFDADAVYLLGDKGNDVVVDRFPRAGGAAQTLATLPSGQYNLALYDTEVWVSGGAIGQTAIQHLPKTGGAPQTAFMGRQCLFGLAVTADAVFCADTRGLARIARSDGTTRALYTSPATLDAVESAVVTADGSTAYVSDGMGQGNGRASRIVKVDVASGATTTLACGLAPPHHLVLGANVLAWTAFFVAVNGTYEVQTLGL